jgi:hypothetical protein
MTDAPFFDPPFLTADLNFQRYCIMAAEAGNNTK